MWDLFVSNDPQKIILSITTVQSIDWAECFARNKEGKIKMLTLPIKKKWFNMILLGEKKEEYREIKPYWTTRFAKVFEFKDGTPTGEDTKEIILRNGYGANTPYIKVLCTLQVKTGKPEWGAEPDILYYVLKIQKITEMLLNVM